MMTHKLIPEPDPQIVQSVIMRVPIRHFFAAVRRKAGNDEQIKKVLDNCAVLLKKNVHIDSELKLCPKEKALPIEELTVGELLCAADNCLSRRFRDDPYISTKANGYIDGIGKLIIERLLIVPLGCIQKARTCGLIDDGKDTEKESEERT